MCGRFTSGLAVMVLARGKASQCREDAPCVFNSHRPNMIKKNPLEKPGGLLLKNQFSVFLHLVFLSKKKHWSVLRYCQGGEVTSFEMSVDFWIQTSPLQWTRKDLDFRTDQGSAASVSLVQRGRGKKTFYKASSHRLQHHKSTRSACELKLPHADGLVLSST